MTGIISRYRELKPLQKAALWLVAAVALYALLGFVIAPVALKTVLEKKLPETLHRQVAIERIRLNPFTLSARVEGFRVARREGEGDFISFDSFSVNLQSLSLFKKALIVKSVALTRPVVAFSRLDDGTFSFSDLLAPPQDQAEEPPQGEEGGFLFSINNIEIIDGAGRYQDHPKGVSHEVSALTLAIPSISNLSSNIEATVQPVFSAVVNGTPVSLAGGSKPFAESRATNVELKMSGIDIPAYLAYIPNPTGLTVASALLDIDTRLSFRAGANSRLSLTGTVALREVEVADRDGRSYLRLPAVTVALGDSNLLEREVRLEEIVIEAPQAEMERLADGQILPLALLASDRGSAAAQAEVKIEEEPTESGAPALRLSLGRLRLEDGNFTFRDRATENPATIDVRRLTLNAEGLTTVPGTSGDFSFSLGLNEKGRVNGEGSLMLEPLSLHSSVRIASLALSDFQPYISERLNVLVAAGDFSLAGDLQVKDNDGIAATFSGEGAVTGLAAADTLTGDDLLQWKDLQVKKIAFSSTPPELSIEEILLREPSTTVRIDEKGKLNLAALVRSDRPGTGKEPSAADVENEEAGAKIAIARVAIESGKALFQDRSISPAYGANLSEFSGAVTGLSSQPGELAGVRFDARLDQAPLVLSGRINPLVEEPFIDLTLDFKNFDLSPLSPYSGRYIGNKVAKGKLNLDLNYRIRGTSLASSNDVFLDQFTLGEAVDSPDATSLPVGLAVALLQNRKGEIRLDIPVQGDLSDPEFSVGGVVLQVLVNLITKAATSPFALLGSLIPAGEDLQHIPFAPGSAALSEEAAKKLELVAGVLHERPGLRMDIAGHADAQVDGRALAEERLRKLVQLEKLRVSGAGKAQGAEAVNVSAEEYPRYLRQVYARMLQTAAAAGGTPPQAAEPAGSEGEAQRMEAYLLSTLVGGEEDLRLLAIERANAVLGVLAASGRVEAGRLFVIEPEAGAAGGESRTTAELLIK